MFATVLGWLRLSFAFEHRPLPASLVSLLPIYVVPYIYTSTITAGALFLVYTATADTL